MPDYIINAGGVINVAAEFEPGGYSREKAVRKVEALYNAVLEVIEIAKKKIYLHTRQQIDWRKTGLIYWPRLGRTT